MFSLSRGGAPPPPPPPPKGTFEVTLEVTSPSTEHLCAVAQFDIKTTTV
jgi:hypothetical protein